MSCADLPELVPHVGRHQLRPQLDSRRPDHLADHRRVVAGTTAGELLQLPDGVLHRGVRRVRHRLDDRGEQRRVGAQLERVPATVESHLHGDLARPGPRGISGAASCRPSRNAPPSATDTSTDTSLRNVPPAQAVTSTRYRPGVLRHETEPDRIRILVRLDQHGLLERALGVQAGGRAGGHRHRCAASPRRGSSADPSRRGVRRNLIALVTSRTSTLSSWPAGTWAGARATSSRGASGAGSGMPRSVVR